MCKMTLEIFYFNYTQASYGPSDLIETELADIMQSNFCKDSESTMRYFQSTSKNKSVLIPYGNCTFVENTVKAEKY